MGLGAASASPGFIRSAGSQVLTQDPLNENHLGVWPKNRVSTSVLDDNDECECLRNTDIKVKEG